MVRVIDCIVWGHDLRLVVLAGALCLFACVTAMSMLARARLVSGATRLAWLASAGAVAGSGIWATHFVAMLAYVSGFPVSYEPALSVLSIAIAMTLCTAGFAIALRPGLTALGGAVTGAAIGAMHYVGMAAMRAPADAIWDVRYVVASVLIGVAMMSAGMRYAYRQDNWRGFLASGAVFTLAICSLHFTGMAAVVFKFDPRVVVSNAVIAPGSLAIAVASVAALIVALGLIGTLVDNHLAARASGEAQRLRDHVAELEATKTELERTSQNLTKALRAADTANRAKSRFLAAMSHELRTPLNAVIGFSEVMRAESFGPLGSARYREYATDINASGTHLLSLINDILDLSRLDTDDAALREETVDLAKTIDEALRMVSPQAKTAGIALGADIDADLPQIRGDERRIKQVLLNLLANALKFTPAGSVSVRARRVPGGIAMAIKDTGIGIAKEDIPRALERFGQIDSTLARKYEGAGLGLPLAKQFVELHGGTLSLESEVGIGTTVTILLPESRILDVRVAA